MAFDGLVLSALVGELNEKLTGAKIMKIYQPEPEDLLLHLHAPSGKYKLFMTANPSFARVSMVKELPENPENPSAFCMLLRKHLQGGRITGIRQIGTERILEIAIESANEIGVITEKKLLIEIMGKHSNIVLVNSENNQILECIKRISANVSRLRQLYPGIKYRYPPVQEKFDFFTFTEGDLLEILKSMHDTAKALINGIQGISPAIAAYLSQAAENKSMEESAADIYGEIENIRKSLISRRLKPCTYYEQGKIKDFHVISIPDYDEYYTVVEHESISDAVEAYYTEREDSNRVSQKSADIKKSVGTKLAKLYLKKQRLLEDLQDAVNCEKYRLYGEILTANLHMVKAGESEVSLTNYYDGSDIRIPLDIKYPPAKNAQNYFKRYGKSKTALKEKRVQLDDTQKEIDYLESVLNFIDEAAEIATIDSIRDELIEQSYIRNRRNPGRKKKKPVKPEPIRYTIYEDDAPYEILVGKNNTENDYLTFKLAAKNDIWMHAKDIPGSHLILRTGGIAPDKLPSSVIKRAASIAAYHSKGKSSDNVPIDYCPAKFVKKPGGAKPGYVIFTHNRTLYAKPNLP